MQTKHLLFLFAGCVLFFFIYSPIPLYFLSDDWDSLLFSLHPSQIFHSFRPFSDASLYIDYRIWKLNASGFHITNFILHFSTCFCFYFLSKKMYSLQNDSEKAAQLSIASSLLFLFYPYHSEAIFWIVARGSVLCTLFSLLSLLFYFKKSSIKLYYFLSLFCFAAALLSYEEAWIIPLMITLYPFFFEKEKRNKSWLPAMGFWVVFIVYLTGRNFFTNVFIGTPYGSDRMININLFLWVKNFFSLIFRSIIIPMQSSVLFSVACLFAAVSLLLWLVWVRKKWNLILYGSGTFFLLSLLPVLPLGIDTHDTESERFLYFPSIFFIIFFIQLLYLAFPKKFTLILAILLFAEGIGLWTSYDSFAKSSQVSKTTIETLKKTGRADTLFCKNMPDQYQGAFIFRNGFQSAVKFAKGDSITTIIILKKAVLFHPARFYKSVFTESDSKINSAVFKNNYDINWTEEKVTISRQLGSE